VDDLPLPHRSKRIQEHHDRFHEEVEQIVSLAFVDQNLPLRTSRRDTPLPFTDIDLECPFVHRRINLETSQLSAPITFDKESSSSHLVVGDSLPSSFPYFLIGSTNTTPAMSSSISMAMVSSTLPPFSYRISSTTGLSFPTNFGSSTSPSSSSLSGYGTTFHFIMGSSPIVRSRVPSTTTVIRSTNTSIPGTFSL